MYEIKKNNQYGQKRSKTFKKLSKSPIPQSPSPPILQFPNLVIYGDKKYMGRGKIADRHPNRQTNRQINTMNRPGLRAGSIENIQLEFTVLKQGAEHQQTSLSFRLEGLKESERTLNLNNNTLCLQVHCSLLQNRQSKLLIFFNGSCNKPKR